VIRGVERQRVNGAMTPSLAPKVLCMGLFLEKPLRIFLAGVPGNELQGTRKRVARMSECDMRDSGCSDILV
jgi:hypothetical protein